MLENYEPAKPNVFFSTKNDWNSSPGVLILSDKPNMFEIKLEEHYANEVYSTAFLN